MNSIIRRLSNYRYNKHLIKNIFKKRRMGLWDRDSLQIISKCSNIILVTFIIRFIGRIYLLYQGSDSVNIFLQESLVGLIIWLLIYGIFSNYLLGIGNTDSRIKIYSTKYIKTLILILIYVIELFISLYFFMDFIYDYFLISLISLVSLLPTLISYVCIFLCIFDFIMYTTDNSDDIKALKGDNIDYF